MVLCAWRVVPLLLAAPAQSRCHRAHLRVAAAAVCRLALVRVRVAQAVRCRCLLAVVHRPSGDLSRYQVAALMRIPAVASRLRPRVLPFRTLVIWCCRLAAPQLALQAFCRLLLVRQRRVQVVKSKLLLAVLLLALEGVCP